MDNNIISDITLNLKKINTVLPDAIRMTIRLIKIAVVLILLLVILALVGTGYSLYEKEDKSNGYKIGLYTGTGVSGLILAVTVFYLIYQYNSFDICLIPIKNSLDYIRKDLTELQRIKSQTYQNVRNINTARQLTGMVRKKVVANSIPLD